MGTPRCQHDQLLESCAALACCCRGERFDAALAAIAWSRETLDAAAGLLHADLFAAGFPHVSPGFSIGPSICAGHVRMDGVDARGETRSFLIPSARVLDALRLICGSGNPG